MTLDEGTTKAVAPTASQAKGAVTGHRPPRFTMTELVRQVSEGLLPDDLKAATDSEWRTSAEAITVAVRAAIPDEHVEWVLHRALKRDVDSELAIIRRQSETSRSSHNRPRTPPAGAASAGRNIWKGQPVELHDFLSAYEPDGAGNRIPRGLMTADDIRASAQRRFDLAAAEVAAGENRLKWAEAMEEHGVEVLGQLPADVLAKLIRPEEAEAA